MINLENKKEYLLLYLDTEEYIISSAEEAEKFLMVLVNDLSSEIERVIGITPLILGRISIVTVNNATAHNFWKYSLDIYGKTLKHCEVYGSLNYIGSTDSLYRSNPNNFVIEFANKEIEG